VVDRGEMCGLTIDVKNMPRSGDLFFIFWRVRELDGEVDKDTEPGERLGVH
jgi:hypothetical protein